MSLLQHYRNDRELFWIHVIAIALSAFAVTAIAVQTGGLSEQL